MCEMYGRASLSSPFPRDSKHNPPSFHRLSSVPLLSLRTHPTSFPFSHLLLKNGWEGDFAETKSWHSCQGRVPITQPPPGFLFLVSCGLILQFCLRQRVPCSWMTRGEVVWGILAAVPLTSPIKS